MASLPETLRAASARVGLAQGLQSLNPAWFALVMATGIVAVAAHMQGIRWIPAALFWMNVVFYGVLWLAYLGRLVMFPRAHLHDLRNHARAMGYFTLPAATAVLGVGTLLIGESMTAARVLWFTTAALWLSLVYAVPVALITRRDKQMPESGLNGTWLVWVVATQGTSILGTKVADTFGHAAEQMILLTTALWLIGGIFYLWVVQMIVRRLFFTRLAAGELSPTYWIDMGAVAISALAGATLLQVAAEHPLLEQMRPFVVGLTLLFWATATWWIPWLVVMGVWRHLVRRYPVTFEAGFWGMVFPLGMYTVATHVTAGAIGLPSLDHLASVFVWIALAAWAGTLADLVVTPLLRKPRSRQRPDRSEHPDSV